MTEVPFAENAPSQAPPPSVPAGWYPDPHGTGQRYWDGANWTTYATPAGQPVPPAHPGHAVPLMHQTVILPTAEKSSGLAVLFTVLWPGAGHMYLGLTKRGTPYLVANAIGAVCWLTGILFLVGLIIWIVTLCMTVGKMSDDTELVNQAMREGRRVVEQ